MTSKIEQYLSYFCVLAAGSTLACSSSDEVCATYACVNQATLSGSLSLAQPPQLLDVQLCLETEAPCQQGLIDLTVNDGSLPCATWNVDSSVCLVPTDTAGNFEVRAAWGFGQAAFHEGNGTVHLVLADHANGEPVLDVSGSAAFKITREDSCHRCWGSEATF